MGIPGLLKEIGKGERIALAKLAFDHFERTNRPLRIAIDAAIWNFQHQSAQGGKNPELRTLFFRLLRLLALPVHPVFVYDGKNKPLTKRGRTVSRYGTCVSNEHSKSLVARFQFPYHTAPGEAEAECATLQKHGIVDAVMSQDVDAIMFGSTLTLRDWSKEGTKGNKSPTHVSVLDSSKIKHSLGLDEAGMILVAMLSGGDYHDGVPGFGSTLSCSAARAGFGSELIELVLNEDEGGLHEWRERLQYELETNESGFFPKKNKTIQIPADFPNRKTLDYYLRPAVTKQEDLKKLQAKWIDWWGKDIDIKELRQYTSISFDWMYKGGAKKFIRCLAQSLFQHRLKTNTVDIAGFSGKNITERRQHFVSDGVPELRFSAVPGEIVGVDLEAEEENPDDVEFEVDDGQDDIEVLDSTTKAAETGEAVDTSNPQKRRKRPPWEPSIVEKWWIPESLLKIGLPDAVKEWNEEQKAIRSDPIKFATRKCRQPTNSSKQIDASMKHGALKPYLPTKVLEKAKPVDEAITQVTKAAKTAPGPSIRQTSGLSSQSDSVDKFFTSTKSVRAASQADNASMKTSATIQSINAKSHNTFAEENFSGRPLHDGLVNEQMSTHALDIVPASVTQRKKRQPKSSEQQQNFPPEEDEEVVFMGVSKAPRSIESFFRPAAVKSNKALMVERSVPQESTILPVTEESMLKKRFAAVPRESLPGAWKDLCSTPDQRSRVSFIDLTNE